MTRNTSRRQVSPAGQVFLSYSRKDLTFAQALSAALTDARFDVLIDIEDIAKGEDWRRRLAELIRKADAVVFILSPDSAVSEECGKELAQAIDLRKRLLPVLARQTPVRLTPPALASLNYIIMDQPGGIAERIGDLASAIRTDLPWVREHTRLAELAASWEGSGQRQTDTLRGKSLDAAEQWLAGQPEHAPEPTALHRAFIGASRQSETRRQQRLVGSAFAVALICAALAIYAQVQRQQAESNFGVARDTVNDVIFNIAQRLKYTDGIRIQVLEQILNHSEKALDRLEAVSPGNLRIRRNRIGLLIERGDVQARSGQRAAAMATFTTALDEARAVAGLDPTRLDWLRDVGLLLGRIGDQKAQSGDLPGAYKTHSEGLELRQTMMDRDPGNETWQADHAAALTSLAEIALQTNRPALALEHLGRALLASRALAAVNDDTARQGQLSAILRHVARARFISGDNNGASGAIAEAINIDRQLGKREPDVAAWRGDLSASLVILADIEDKADRPVAARKALEEALQLSQKLSDSDRSNNEWLRDLGLIHGRIGDIDSSEGEPHATIEPSYAEKLRIARILVSRDRENPILQLELAESHRKAGLLAARAERIKDAEVNLGSALSLQLQWLRPAAENPEVHLGGSGNLMGLGDQAHSIGDGESARQAYAEALAMRRLLLARRPGDPTVLTDVVEALRSLAVVCSHRQSRHDLLSQALDLLNSQQALAITSQERLSWVEQITRALAQNSALP